MKAIRIPVKFDPSIVMYYVLKDSILKKFAHICKVRPTERFFNMIHELVVNHAIHGEEPPRPIESAILNIADDMLAGREVTLRAGDYISLMDYAREQKTI